MGKKKGSKEANWICNECNSKIPINHLICETCYGCKLNSTAARNSLTLKKAEAVQTVLSPLPDENIKVNLTTDRDSGVLQNFHPWKCTVCNFINTKLISVCHMCKMFRYDENDFKLTPLELAHKQWQYITDYCTKRQSSYTDITFPTTSSSLYFNPVDKKNNCNITWKRPKDIKGAADLPWTVFRNSNAADTKQGCINDCWLISVMTALAERRDLLHTLIPVDEINGTGVYLVKLFINGDWIPILIDDYFPCNENNELIYSKAANNQLWVTLIEKAAAKLYGCYEALETGVPICGLMLLTGAACETIHLRPQHSLDRMKLDKDSLWALLSSYKDTRYVMLLSSGLKNYHGPSLNGFKDYHSYALLDMKYHCSGRYLQLKDPWGNDTRNHPSWMGEQSDTNLKKTGIFWTLFEDILEHFQYIDICRIKPNVQAIKLTGTLPIAGRETFTCVKITVFEITGMDVTLYQGDENNNIKRPELDLNIGIYKTEDGCQLTEMVTTSRMYLRRFVSSHALLDPGEYIIVPQSFNHWLSSEQSDCLNYNMVISTSRAIFVETFEASHLTLADAVILKAITMSQPVYKKGTIYYFCSSFVAGQILVAENSFRNHWIFVECDLVSHINIASTRNKWSNKDYIPPYHRQIISVIVWLDPRDEFLFHTKVNSKLVNDGYGFLENNNMGLHAVRPIR